MSVNNKKITLLVVEDSRVQRDFLLNILGNRDELKVIGIARNGMEAIETLKHIKPDVVLMDLHMPVMNGIEAIRHIMSTCPLPIIAMSASSDLDEAINGFHALAAGAIAFTEKPTSLKDHRFDSLCAYLFQTVKLMAEIKVVRRRPVPQKEFSMTDQDLKNITIQLRSKKIELIAIGASTGGPVILQTILQQLSDDFPPILIIQHIVPGFISGLSEWLTQTTHCRIHVASDNQSLARGHVYLAPDYYQMGVSNYGRIVLKSFSDDTQTYASVNFLFNTVASVMKDHAIGILLTGMGSDGVEKLKMMKEAGAITIAQDKKSSLIFGMPGQAIAQHAADYTLTPEQIAAVISSLANT